MDEQAYDLTVPANRESLIHIKGPEQRYPRSGEFYREDQSPKVDVCLSAYIGRNRPKADVNVTHYILLSVFQL